ncbi:GRAM domain-containing protein, partial [Rhodotorula diobovata]
MNDSGPSSDSSEPVLVSRPASPHSAGAGPNTTNAPTTTTTTTTTNPGTADLGAPLTSNPSLSSTQSPAPPVKVLKDSSSETVAALQPTPANTTSGLGRPGEEERAHLAAPGKVLGGAEGVVGESFGLQPEWIVKVRRDRTSAPAGAAGGAAADDVDDVDDEGHDGAEGAGGGKGKPKWFKKVKHGISTAAASIKDKASDAGSITSSGSRGGGGGSSILGRARTRSVGQKSAVGFDVEDEEEDDDDDAAAKTTATKVVTDHEGRPVPLDVGAGAAEGTPPSSTPDGAVTRATAPSTGNASATTSVKDKILESFDAEPATTQEKFHSMFSELPEDEELIEDFRCALQRDILVQGKLYVSEHYLSFRASILGWETTLKIPWTEIVSIEKRMTAKIIPNAIEVRTLHATHSFSSFIARDASFALLVAVWKHVHPEADQLEAASRKAARAEKRRLRSLSAATSVRSAPEPTTGSDSDGESDARSEITFEDEQGHKKRHRFKHKLAALKGSIRSAGTSSSASASAGSATPASGPTEAEKVKAQALTGSGPGAGDSGHAATVYDGPEFKNVALDTVLPTCPGKAYELFFGDAAFLKAFMEGKEGLKEVDIGAWKPVNGPCEERDLTYLKPLNAPVGPKQTQCIIHDVNELRDEEAAIATLTTTKTP